jgi:Sulfotransferase domain
MPRLLSNIDDRLRNSLPRPAYRYVREGYHGARALVGLNPARRRLLPDFIVIGAAKSGTTSLYSALADHPFVEPCMTDNRYFDSTKEVHYFDYNYYLGTDWYRTHFPLAQERLEFEREHRRRFLTGEASPTYISHPWAPGRIRELLPDVKLIAVLRNPVDRAYSHFQLSRRQGEETIESFEEAVAREDERLRPELERMAADRWYNSWPYAMFSYLARSRYAEQLERWLELFPREQFLFLKAEDLFGEPGPVIDTVYDFLGLPAHRPERLPRLNTAEYQTLPADTRARLTEYFRPHNERLYELIGVDFGWERVALTA